MPENLSQQTNQEDYDPNPTAGRRLGRLFGKKFIGPAIEILRLLANPRRVGQKIGDSTKPSKED